MLNNCNSEIWLLRVGTLTTFPSPHPLFSLIVLLLLLPSHFPPLFSLLSPLLRTLLSPLSTPPSPCPSPLPPPLCPSLLQAVLADADIAVLRCVIVEVHPDRTSRKIPRSLQPTKTIIQIGKVLALQALQQP